MTGILVKESLSDDVHHERPPSCQVEASHQTNVSRHISSTPIQRDISGLNMIATAFNICNSWVACATTLAIAISAGGTFTVIYGIIVVGAVYVCVAMTLAELASVYPTSGGQYHFTYILAPRRLRRGLSYLCGVAATCSWLFLAAGVTILASQVLLALAAFYNESYNIKDWHYFLVFQAINLISHIYNILLLKKTLWIHEVGCKCFLSKIHTILTASEN